MFFGSVVTVILAVVIGIITLATVPSGGPAGIDKLYHIIAFAMLAFPLPFVRPKLAIWVVLVVFAYGGTIEAIQPFLGRQGEWTDLVADGIGAVCGVAFAYLMRIWLQRRWKDDTVVMASKIGR